MGKALSEAKETTTMASAAAATDRSGDDRRAPGVVTFGQPLVDLSMRVTGETLRALGITREQEGGCIGIAPDAMAQLKRDLLAASGGVLPDDEGGFAMCAGGSAANVAKALALLGTRAAFYGQLGRDEEGAYFAAALRKKGVRVLAPERASDLPTGNCLCLVSSSAASEEDGDGGGRTERTMRTCHGASADISSKDWNPRTLDNGGAGRYTHMHAEGYLVAANPELFAQLLETARSDTSPATTTSMDLASFDLVRAKRDTFKKALVSGGVNVLFCNEEEAKAFAEEEAEEAEISAQEGDAYANVGPQVSHCLRVLRRYAETVVVSLGPQGCVALSREGREFDLVARAAAPKIPVLDTTGAGDFFTAGFLHARLSGRTLQESCADACIAGAAACLQVGTDINSETLHAFIQQTRSM
mmetsp:Transcript_1795/g.4148  ORF Transcript_1795/g.4148 Transcript_1795/m.4148 type:complete len:415 (-) Transcript_1795:30-1274(-)